MSEKEIRNAIKKGKLVIGSRQVMKGLVKGSMSAVFFTGNCPKELEKRAIYYSSVSGTKVSRLEGNSQHLGEMCGRPFRAVMVGILK